MYLHRNHLEEFPRFIHSWTQSDRYALSLGFVDNGLDLFHPQSYNLRPDPEHVPVKETGITPVDLPLPEFIVAVGMKILGDTGPGLFRIYNIAVSCLGLMFLYYAVKKITGNTIKAVIISLFALASPVYFYYQGGFLPTITSLSIAFAAIYCFYSSDKRVFAVYLFALAGMIRTPFMIPFLAASFLLILEERRFILHAAIAIAVFLLLSWWNSKLAADYGSLFLRKLMHAESFTDAIDMARESWKNWGTAWFTTSHYIFIFFLIVLSVLIYLYPARDKKENPSKKLFHLPILWFLGAVAYFFLMEAQFVQHDYYFLDSFFAPVVLIVALLTIMIPLSLKHVRNAFIVGSGILLAFAANANYRNQDRRREVADWDRYEITYTNFSDASTLMDQLKIPADAKMLVIDAYTINTPLILMDRKGYTVTNTNEKTITQALEWNYDYIVIQDQFLISDVIKQYPPIRHQLKRVGGNGKITVYTRSKGERGSYADLLGLKESEKKGMKKIESCVLNKDAEFGCTVEIPVNDVSSTDRHYVIVSSKVKYSEPLNELFIVCDASTGEQHVSYQKFTLAEYVTGKENETVEFLFSLPKGLNAEVLKVYIWNPGADDNLEARDFEVTWY